MRMPRYDIHEFTQFDPEQAFQVVELGIGFLVQSQGIMPGEGERVDVGLRHLVADLAPE